MKPIIIISSFLILSVVISCTVRNYKLPFQRDRPIVLMPEVAPPPPQKMVPVPFPVPDTPRDNTTPPVIVEQVLAPPLDTAQLRLWLDSYYEGRYTASIMDDPRVIDMIRQAGVTMDEYEELLRQLIATVEAKEAAEQEVQVIKNALFNAPVYMWLLHAFFALIMVLMIYKVHYSRMKIQAYIDGRIKKL